MVSDDVLKKLETLSEGYSECLFDDKRYRVHMACLQENKITKFYAEELGGKDFISLNLYKTPTQYLLKPCEMPVEKVTNFILGMTPIP